jgi:hypothetical protein
MGRGFKSHTLHQIKQGVGMSHEEEKIKHSKRIFETDNAVKKQVKIAKEFGIVVDEPHKFAKHHAMNCGNPRCVMCSNPRKVFKEKTIQEQRLEQDLEKED